MAISNDNVIRVKSHPYRYSIYWVDFPQPIGRHPAVVLSHDKYTPCGSCQVIVAPITSTEPRGMKYEDLWIPISLEEDRVSYIKMNSIMYVHKLSLEKCIGFIPEDKYCIIAERYMALFTGADVRRLVDDPADGDCLYEDEDKPDEFTPAPTNVAPDNTPDNKQYALTLESLHHILTDVTIDTRQYRNYFVNKNRLVVSKLKDADLLGVLVAFIREYGMDSIGQIRKHGERFDAIVNRMVKRGIMSVQDAMSIRDVLSVDFAKPANSILK